MIKKQWFVALVLFLLIPLVVTLGGKLFSAIDPEIAARHSNYARNYHLLNLLRLSILWGSLAVSAVLWFVVCSLVIRSKKRSQFWLLLAVFGPLGFAVLAMLNDRAPAETDKYSRFLRHLYWPLRGVWEFCAFLLIWIIAYQVMVLKRNLMIWYQSATTGVSRAQIMDIQNQSSGMWAFSEGNEVMYFAILLYLLVPVAFAIAGRLQARKSQAEAH